jgi:hypothetical protein
MLVCSASGKGDVLHVPENISIYPARNGNSIVGNKIVCLLLSILTKSHLDYFNPTLR